MNSSVTLAARTKLAKARTGEIVLPKITGMAFGDGATNADGDVLSPVGETLKNELLRKQIDGYEKVSDTCYQYACTLDKQELVGKSINEIGLYDAEGDIILMKSFSNKIKDADMQMIFTVNDQF